MPIAEVSSKKVPLISYVQAGSRRKNPIEAFDGSFEYILTDNEVSDFTLLYASKAIRWSQTSRLEM